MSANKNRIVVGLGFGDEGKGATTEFLARTMEADNVVKFSGGSQTAHNIVLADGRHHTFAQFGSATLSGVPSLLSRFAIVNLFAMASEASHLQEITGANPFLKTHISETCLLITPVQEAANRKREKLRGNDAHGSCGVGVGETRGFSIKHPIIAPRIVDLKQFNVLGNKIDLMRKYLEAELGELDAPSTEEILYGYQALLQDQPIEIVSDRYISNRLKGAVNIFEGTQGVLLDEWNGFHPHTTWSDTTSANAQQLLIESGLEAATVVGATRSYHTRHGNGPFPTEFSSEDWHDIYPEPHNTWGEFQGGWRAGALDLVLLNYAVRANGGVDEIAVNHLDVDFRSVATSYEGVSYLETGFQDRENQIALTSKLNNAKGTAKLFPVDNEDTLISIIEGVTTAPVTIRGYGPTFEDRVGVIS